jgi:hypothetical protein
VLYDAGDGEGDGEGTHHSSPFESGEKGRRKGGERGHFMTFETVQHRIFDENFVQHQG